MKLRKIDGIDVCIATICVAALLLIVTVLGITLTEGNDALQDRVKAEFERRKVVAEE